MDYLLPFTTRKKLWNPYGSHHLRVDDLIKTVVECMLPSGWRELTRDFIYLASVPLKTLPLFLVRKVFMTTGIACPFSIWQTYAHSVVIKEMYIKTNFQWGRVITSWNNLWTGPHAHKEILQLARKGLIQYNDIFVRYHFLLQSNDYRNTVFHAIYIYVIKHRSRVSLSSNIEIRGMSLRTQETHLFFF